MDTKWKKSKKVVSFLAFAAGMTLIFTNLPSAAAAGYLLRESLLADLADLPDLPQASDYQKSAEFRNIMEERLNDLLGVATGGSGWYTGAANTNVTLYGYDGGLVGWLDRSLHAGTAETTVVADVAETTGNAAAEIYFEESDYSDYEQFLLTRGISASEAAWNEYLIERYGTNFADVQMNGSYESYVNLEDYRDEDGNLDREKILEAYLYDLDQDKNLRYAVVYEGELLYTNIDGLAEETGKPWDGGDFAKALPEDIYNFTLWYNRAGDGKVQITKDGWEQDVYGDGVYRAENDWRVPGYANFTLGGSAKEAVIFLAAAKEPQLYLTGNYEGDGVTQYGGELYYLCDAFRAWSAKFTRACELMGIGVVLLFLALLLHKSLKEAFGGIVGFLRKIPLPVKTVLFVILLVFSVVPGGDAIGQASWYLQDGGGDAYYLQSYLHTAGVCTAIWFWLLFWAFTDGRANAAAQVREMADRRKLRDLKYPIQKRLVRRDRNRLLLEGGVLLVFIAALLLLYLLFEAYIRVNFWAWQGNEALEDLLKFPVYVIMTAFLTLAVFMIFVGVDALRLKKTRRLAEDIGALSDRIAAVKDGELTGEWKLPEDSDLREAAENLNKIRTGLETALTEQVKSERMKVNLVTNVSHDIKTPLTSIISYVELLRQEEDLPQDVKEYIQILGEKSERLKSIVQDVFEVSKATSGQLPMQIETLDLGKLLRQTLADMQAQIEAGTLVMRASIPQESVNVQADGQRLYRVFQNLIQNALQYSLEGSRIYMTLVSESERAVVQIKNTSSVELTENKDFTERFVRGDESRTDGGSGLGLSIAKSFTEACGGSFQVETDADLFTVTVSFPETPKKQES
ncbi:MAG: HAMP domain-containing histidine kinase [Bacteroidales bacterium]|nr:HAMP domain-containing histidine kinase [Bacteroidales bacterium]MCM1416268.1 HAMP domain-containing histidine kinase [bacterium]MCM1422376.1 HAMP domain-containing histidine kinase [bacterium]